MHLLYFFQSVVSNIHEEAQKNKVKLEKKMQYFARFQRVAGFVCISYFQQKQQHLSARIWL